MSKGTKPATLFGKARLPVHSSGGRAKIVCRWEMVLCDHDVGMCTLKPRSNPAVHEAYNHFSFSLIHNYVHSKGGAHRCFADVWRQSEMF